MIIRRLIAPLAVAVVAVYASQGLFASQGFFVSQASAQSAFPAPLPNQPPVNDPAFPPVNGSAPIRAVPGPSASFPVNGAAPLSGAAFERPAAPPQGPQAGGPADNCMKGFMPLREEAEKRGKLIKVASERHASPVEACKLIKEFGQAELKMIKYVEVNSAKCGIPPQIAEQLKNGHKNTEGMQNKVCDVAQKVETRAPAGPSLSEVLGSATALPEATAQAKKGGSTFDTLNGNVLTR